MGPGFLFPPPRPDLRGCRLGPLARGGELACSLFRELAELGRDRHGAGVMPCCCSWERRRSATAAGELLPDTERQLEEVDEILGSVSGSDRNPTESWSLSEYSESYILRI